MSTRCPALLLFLVLFAPRTSTADTFTIDFGAVNVWPPDIHGAIRLFSGRDFLLSSFEVAGLGDGLFCETCSPPRTRNPHQFRVTLPSDPRTSTFALIGSVIYPTSEVQFTFAGQFSWLHGSVELASDLGRPYAVELNASILGVDRASGETLFNHDLTGFGRAYLVQSDPIGQRGVLYDFTPTPEPAGALLIGAGGFVLAIGKLWKRKMPA